MGGDRLGVVVVGGLVLVWLVAFACCWFPLRVYGVARDIHHGTAWASATSVWVACLL